MRDLFHRRADKSGETFPARLPNNSQAATVSARRLHQRIVWKRSADFREPMIQREIMRGNSRERSPPVYGRRRPATADFQKIPVLLHINWSIANRAAKSIADSFPMKYLARIEGHRQIEIGS
jgi:hypothetical protein